MSDIAEVRDERRAAKRQQLSSTGGAPERPVWWRGAGGGGRGGERVWPRWRRGRRRRNARMRVGPRDPGCAGRRGWTRRQNRIGGLTPMLIPRRVKHRSSTTQARWPRQGRYGKTGVRRVRHPGPGPGVREHRQIETRPYRHHPAIRRGGKVWIKHLPRPYADQEGRRGPAWVPVKGSTEWWVANVKPWAGDVRTVLPEREGAVRRLRAPFTSCRLNGGSSGRGW